MPNRVLSYTFTGVHDVADDEQALQHGREALALRDVLARPSQPPADGTDLADLDDHHEQ